MHCCQCAHNLLFEKKTPEDGKEFHVQGPKSFLQSVFYGEMIDTAILIIIEGQFQSLQWFSSSKTGIQTNSFAYNRYGEDVTKHAQKRTEEVKELLQFDQLKRELALMAEVRQIKNLLTGADSQTETGEDHEDIPEEYVLKVSIVSARHLPRMDITNGTDAYCVISVDDLQDEVYQTRVVLNSINPEWNANFKWVVPAEAQLITIAMMDRDTLTQDDLVGLCLLHVYIPFVAASRPATWEWL
jgi:hypothetical protein